MPNAMAEPELLDRLAQVGALLEGHFELASGLHSPSYLLLPRLLEQPRLAEPFIAALAERAAAFQAETVFGPAMGGVILAYEVARVLGLRAIYAEKEGDGFAFRRGFQIRRDERLVAVEDAMTTGGSLRRAIAAARTQGGLVVGAAVLVDRSGGAHQLDVPVASVLRLDIPTYPPADCPLCRAGSQAVKPKLAR